jgi:hypothetical protein
MKLFVVLFLSIIPLTSYASTCNDNCTETPTCEFLGYFKDATCENEYITCPFDSSYKWCKQYTCSDGKYHDEHPVEAGWECREISYKGSSCLDCECKPLDSCKYNANNATLSIRFVSLFKIQIVRIRILTMIFINRP